MNRTSRVLRTTSDTNLASELAQRTLTDYSISTELSSELRVGTLAYFSIQQEFTRISKAIKSGSPLQIERIDPLLKALVDSIIRNPAAGVWLARLKSKSSYAHRHCISCAILCAVMGRQLGFDTESMHRLSLAGLLMDSGKLLLADSLLRKTQSLSPAEQQETQRHTELGLEAVASADLPEEVLQVIRYHHERFDGSGYPDGLSGTQIPLFARIAAIVDCYDAMTSPRYYATPIVHSEAIMKLAGWRKTLFQKELVDTFIQAIGLYPPGSLVELTSGEVAVVSDFRVGMGRKPELTVILDANKNRLTRKKALKLTGKEGNIDIAKNLPPDAYNLDPEALF
ncbi:HD domain-containing protein [Porticoccaceae bacterium]|nr:HD domain-containing protein [Porticoccaceae bacterium]MDA8935634.1 HD domain-containing protein [Porticoccaceae bacterium]MDC3249147.1 HD domain-containing protein [Porticoccaceae bacterium]